MEIGQLLTFNVYGYIVKGKFLSITDKDVITIEVTQDASGVFKIGDKDEIHKDFLINQ